MMNHKIQCSITSVDEFKDPKLFQKGLALLPDFGSWKERKESISRLRRQESRLESLVAGLMLRTLLLENSLPLEALSVSEKVNLSHSNGYVVCAFGSVPCGIDIQKEKEDRSNIARIFFTESEYALVQKYGVSMFTRIWALKESYVKYKGEGLSLPLKSFQVYPGSYDILSDGSEWSRLSTCISTIYSTDRTCQAREFAFNDYRIAVCSALATKPNICRLSTESLLRII